MNKQIKEVELLETLDNEVIQKMGPVCGTTDFAVLLGCGKSRNQALYDDSPLGDSCYWMLKNNRIPEYVDIVSFDGKLDIATKKNATLGLRPVIPFSSIPNINEIIKTGIENKQGVLEVIYGEFPQKVVPDAQLRNYDFENAFKNNKLVETGQTITVNDADIHDKNSKFTPQKYKVYEFYGRKFIKINSRNNSREMLSNIHFCQGDQKYWLEVTPIEWFVDMEGKRLISKYSLFSGIKYDEDDNNNDFKASTIYNYLNNYFANEIVQEKKKESKKKNGVLSYHLKGKVTLLDYDQVLGSNRLDMFDKYGTNAQATDYIILLGVSLRDEYHEVTYTNEETQIVAGWFTKTNESPNVKYIEKNGTDNEAYPRDKSISIRPVIKVDNIQDFIDRAVVRKDGILEVEYGEYPQYTVTDNLRYYLDEAYDLKTLKETGKKYTSNDMDIEYNLEDFHPLEHIEYEYNGKKYLRVESNGSYVPASGKSFHYKKRYDGKFYYWVEVSPIKWFIDEKQKLLVSKDALISNIRFDKKRKYDGNFEDTMLYEFLNESFAKDIIPSDYEKLLEEEQNGEDKRKNPYKFKFKETSEEEIIKGSIDSGIAVFLHGPSSEGKSARVKQIDPNCVILYLGSATPESINGKSVYNAIKNEMIDVKPSWLNKLETICKNEPDKNHIVFFDELTNALPSIQSMAFNIVLDREVNGMWKLPDNARIVASGNDMKDSISANQLAEPLFNRFAHVYIKTTTESWLKWASENNIHPAIYAYIAYKNGEVLRSKYDGEKPNADPRKWEMASKMLYQTSNPEMLRALVGEDITREFVEFCNQSVITLDDVLSGNYKEEDITYLNTAEKYATVMALSKVDEDNLDKVRNFVNKLSPEYLSLFDGIWTHGDEKRLERIMESKLSDDIVK